MRIILHIDFDSFFASVEQQDHPELRGKPLGVTAHNGRTAIIAASREAKKLGIKSPSRTFEALKICPSLQFARANFTRYWEISKQFITICKDFSPFVEIFSLDELFMDITKTAYLFGGVHGLIHRLQGRIRREIGEYITVSIGVAENKLLAKLASGLKKPNGIVFITPENLDQIYAEAKLTDICGIGSRIEARLHTMGITSLMRLRHVPLAALIAEFGNVEGHFLKNVGLGIDKSELVPYTEAPDAKSVSRNFCLAHNEFDRRKVLQQVCELCEEVGIKLRRLNKKAKTFGMSLRGRYSMHGRYTNSYFADSGSEMFRACLRTLSDDFFENNYVRQISVWAGNLQDRNTLTYDLFKEQQRKDTLVHLTDIINERFGDHTIRNAFLLNAPKLTTMPNGYGSDRYERMKFAKEANEILANDDPFNRSHSPQE